MAPYSLWFQRWSRHFSLLMRQIFGLVTRSLHRHKALRVLKGRETQIKTALSPYDPLLCRFRWPWLHLQPEHESIGVRPVSLELLCRSERSFFYTVKFEVK